MKENKKTYLRPIGKVSDMIPLAAIITFLLVVAGQLLGNWLVGTFSPEATENAPFFVFCAYFEFIGIWIVLLAVMASKQNRPMFKTILPNSTGNTGLGIATGLLLGFLMNAFCAIASIFLKDIAISFDTFNLFWAIAILLAVAVQSGAEELVCRCYLYQSLRRRYKNPAVAIVFSALLFSALHLANPGLNIWAVIQILVIGILLSILVYYYNSFWAAIFVHTAWNYTQNIIFGLPNSGIVVPYSFFHLDAASQGFFFDPHFGIEGSPGACLIITIVTILLLMNARKRGMRPEDVWAETEQELLSSQAAAAEVQQ